ncbi:unnamed protein product [Dovyalis caffra]|uniref:Uncharacterized protein n=1 Tax=Dovyalis caffra TaxID=77055 RepID=A0AAV1RB90_9ROSI|nr:unnamed protein product [Dovyalis caffra]
MDNQEKRFINQIRSIKKWDSELQKVGITNQPSYGSCLTETDLQEIFSHPKRNIME